MKRKRIRLIPGAILRRDKGGGQSQMQGGQEEALESENPIVFLNLQYKAGPHTPKAEMTANITKQHLKQAPDLLDISLSLSFSNQVSCNLPVKAIESKRWLLAGWIPD
ncbi:unnamed protein product [Dovyalis caffra]|uniref:Uncharacterized protein n=1 Tax=Dovyalis caffra TaxID=77055 RepID=A0AAV1RNG6_9ROSI|nr:unnamed protein product [Dovyalis caffra]